MPRNKERLEQVKDYFPEPRAFFILPDSHELQEVRYFDEKKKREIIGKAQKIAASVRISRLPKHTGELQSQREVTQARKAQMARIAVFPYEVDRMILSSDPDDPLVVTVSRSASLRVESGKRLPEEEVLWREFLMREGLTDLWGDPLLSVAREFFLLRTGRLNGDLSEFLQKPELKKMEEDPRFSLLLAKMNIYVRSLQPRETRARR